MADTATKPLDTAAQPPREFQKHTRACFRCKLVKTYEQVRVRPNRPEAPPISRASLPHGRPIPTRPAVFRPLGSTPLTIEPHAPS